MRKISGYVCDVCGTFYDIEKHAYDCELIHAETKKVMKIAGVGFKNLKDRYGHDRAFFNKVPDTIRVQFSDDRFDFAIYSFKRYGPEGL